MHIVSIQCIPCFCRSLVTPSCSCAQITESCSRVISIHLCSCAAMTKSTRTSRSRIQNNKKKIQYIPFVFSGYFPRFHKQVLRSGKQHIEREMEGRRRKLDEKEGGLRGYNPTTSKKKSAFLLFLHLSHLSFPRMLIYSKFLPGHDEDAAALTGDGRTANKH